MRTLDLSRFVVNEHYSVWAIDFALSASFELPAERLHRVLPAGVQAMEARPGVALLNLAVFSFAAGTDGLTAPCVEVVASVHVIPDLAVAPTLPRVSMYTLRLGATTREFIDSGFATDHYPVYPEPLDVRIDRQRISADVFDEEGRQVLSLAAAAGVTPRYEDDRFYVQSTTSRDNQLFVAGNLFEFRRAENQRRLETGGAPVAHPFFAPVDVSGVTAKQGYMQMWTEPGTVGRENHFFLQAAR